MSFKALSVIMIAVSAIKLNDDPICSTDPEYCKKFNTAEANSKFAVTYPVDVPLDGDVISTEKHWKN